MTVSEDYNSANLLMVV